MSPARACIPAILVSATILAPYSPSFAQVSGGDSDFVRGTDTTQIDVYAYDYEGSGDGGSPAPASPVVSSSAGDGSAVEVPPDFPDGLFIDNVCGLSFDENILSKTPLFHDEISGCIVAYEDPPQRPGPRGPRGGGGNPAPDPGRIIDRVTELVAAPKLDLAPSEIGLTGLETFVWTERPQPVSVTAQAGGTTVTARARVAHYLWDWGDGAQSVTDHPGRRWTRSQLGTIGHVYETTARYDLTLEVVWAAEWRIGSGPWHRLGYFSLADTLDYPVREIQSRLTRTGD